jgi:hypothetical protein
MNTIVYTTRQWLNVSNLFPPLYRPTLWRTNKSKHVYFAVRPVVVKSVF